MGRRLSQKETVGKYDSNAVKKLLPLLSQSTISGLPILQNGDEIVCGDPFAERETSKNHAYYTDARVKSIRFMAHQAHRRTFSAPI
jgi:hypothetical protein